MADQNGENQKRDYRETWLWRWGIAGWLLVGVLTAIVFSATVFFRASAVLIPLIIAIIIGVLLEPFVDFQVKHRIPRWLAVVVTLILIIAVVVGFLTVVIYGVSTQAGKIEKQVESGITKLKDWFNHKKVTNQVINWVEDSLRKAWPGITSGLTKTLFHTVPGVASFLVGMFIGFFMLMFILGDDGKIKEFVAGHLGVPRSQGDMILNEVFASIRGYFRGTTIIATMNAVVIIPVVLILKVPLLGAIVLITFVTCYIPSFGGYIGGAFAVFIALASQGLTAGIIMLVFAIISHTILQNPVQAIAYGKTLNLHPLVALLVTLLGAVFAGIAGAILAVPITAVVIKVVAKLKEAREEDAAAAEGGGDAGKPPDEPAVEPA